jgi:excisionase family DNA binding protein
MEIVLTTRKDLKELLKEALLESKDSSRETDEESKEVEKLLTKKEAAELLSVSLATVDNYRRNGTIPSYRIGSAVRFKKNELIQAFTGK